MNLKTIIAGLCATTTLGYMLTKSDNLSRHCDPPYLDKSSDTNLCFIREYKHEITQTARTYNLPPELIGAILYQENDCRLTIQDTADFISTIIGRNHSAGPAQIYTTTAARLDGLEQDLTRNQIYTYYQQLNSPENAISYVARELAYLQKTTQVNALTVEGKDLLASEYRTGHQQRAQINNHGYDILIILRRPDIYKALGIAVPNNNRQQIQDHLNHTKKERVK